MKLTKEIKVPSSGKNVRYNGAIPEHLDIQDGQINFTMEHVDTAFNAGEIDYVNREHLRRVLVEYKHNPGVIRDILLYRHRIANNMKPGQELFIKMQELGLKHHLKLGKRGLDISGYDLPMFDLSGGIISGRSKIVDTLIRGEFEMIESKIWSKLELNNSRFFGGVNLFGANIDGPVDLRQARVWNGVDLGMVEIWGDVDLRQAWIMGNFNTQGSMISADIIKDGSEIVEK